MTPILSKLGFGRGEAESVEAALDRIDRAHLPVHVELERSLIRFNSRLSFKRNAVVVAKPPRLGPELQTGSFVRFKVPETLHKELRLEVMTPHFNLSNNQAAFLCKVPKAFAPPSRRSCERFDTSRYGDLRLELPRHGGQFRVLDISERGCRIQTASPHPRDKLPPSEEIGDAVIHMGRNVRVELAKARPRTYHGNSVGLAFAVDPGSDNRKLLLHLLQSLERAQQESLSAQAG
jgi:hypothetical protein